MTKVFVLIYIIFGAGWPRAIESDRLYYQNLQSCKAAKNILEGQLKYKYKKLGFIKAKCVPIQIVIPPKKD